MLRIGAVAFMAAALMISCAKNDEPEPDLPDEALANAALALRGTSSEVLPVKDRILSGENGVYTYAGVLSEGGLSFKTNQNGNPGLLFISKDETEVLLAGAEKPVKRGYYEFEIDLNNSTFKMIKKVEFESSGVWLAGREVFAPRSDDEDILTSMTPMEGGGFKYEYYQTLGKGDLNLYFQDDKTKSTAYKLSDGTIGFFAKDEDRTSDAKPWSITEDGDYRIAVDMLTRKVEITKQAYVPDRVTALYVIGNVFGNGGSTPAEVEQKLAGADEGDVVQMTRSAMDPDVFTITRELEAASGGFWFVFQQNRSIPSLIKDPAESGKGKVFFTTNNTDADDTDVANQWTVDDDAKYILTVNVRTREVSVEPADPPLIPKGYDLYIAGEAARGIPEADRKFTFADEVYKYDKVVNKGPLYLVAKKSGEADIELFINSAGTAVGKETPAGFTIPNKSFYTVTVDPRGGKYTPVVGKTIGDYIWMHALHVNYPRYGTSVIPAEMPISAKTDNPFVFESCNHFYYLKDYDAGAYTGFSFFLEPSHNNAVRLYDAGNGKLGIGGENDWQITQSGDLRITMDILNMSYKIERITFYPDNVQAVWVIGNTFSDAAKDFWGGSSPTNMEEDVRSAHHDFGPSILDRYTFDGLNIGMNGIKPPRFQMVRDLQNPSKFTITKELKVSLGGFWFLLRPKGSLPSLYKDANGKAKYYLGEPGLPTDYGGNGGARGYSSRDSQDVLPDNHWKITEDGTYTITLDVSTNEVTVVKQ